MPFIPHTADEIQAMLNSMGEPSMEALFDQIPSSLLIDEVETVPEGINEQQLNRLYRLRAQQNQQGLCFIGAGAYQHHIPAAVWDIAMRGEFLTAYTPYQAEASQGTLQLLYEFQTMMAGLTGMDVANASLYDAGSGLGEAMLMALRSQGKKNTSKKILVAETVHPFYRQAARTLVQAQQIDVQTLAYDKTYGIVDSGRLPAVQPDEYAALVIQYPNFFGGVEAVDTLTDWAHQHNMLVVAVVNPTALALLKAPGEWGEKGADIVCGDTQPLGIPLASGGPYCGFLCSRLENIRQMPGRLVGRTTDSQGQVGFSLTLQAREQHIRRAKATSNICTNQGLLVTASTIYLSLLGPQGLAEVAKQCHANTRQLVKQLTALPGVDLFFSGPYFHEAVLRLPKSVATVLPALASQGIQAGYGIARHYPALENALLVCATETKTSEDIALFAQALAKVLQDEAVLC